MRRRRYREQKYYMGDYLEVSVYPVYEYPRSGSRRKLRKPSREAQERLNQKNAELALSRLILANFTSEDIKLELTYAPSQLPETLERARQDLKNFFAKVRRRRKKLGLPELKYIYSQEVGSRTGRVHFHLILSGGLSLRELQKLWGKGYVDKVQPLMFSETGVRGLAKYFCKQKLGESGIDEKNKKRYQSSKNCIKPQPRNNDFKISAKKAAAIAHNSEDRRAIEKLYPDYFCAECKAFYNEINGEYYLNIMLYRKDFEPDIYLNEGRGSFDT